MNEPITIAKTVSRAIVVNEGAEYLQERMTREALASLAQQKERILEEFVLSGAMPRDLIVREWPVVVWWNLSLENARVNLLVQQRIEVV